jgi:hypothetical protein
MMTAVVIWPDAHARLSVSSMSDVLSVVCCLLSPVLSAVLCSESRGVHVP